MLAAFAVPLAIASTAWACGRLATLYLSSDAGRPGAEVNASGSNYNTAPTSSEVIVRWNSRSGPELFRARPDANGRISGSFQVPSSRPGNYTVVATQTLANGNQATGTPGRAPFRIRGRRSRSELPLAPLMWGKPPADQPPGAAAPASDGSGFSLPLPLMIVLGLGVGGLALTVLGRRARTARSTLQTAE